MWDLSRHLGKGYIHIYLFTIDDVARPYRTVFMKLSDKARLFLLDQEIAAIFFVPRLRFLKPLMLVGHVIGHQVHNQSNTQSLGLVYHVLHILHSA